MAHAEEEIQDLKTILENAPNIKGVQKESTALVQ